MGSSADAGDDDFAVAAEDLEKEIDGGGEAVIEGGMDGAEAVALDIEEFASAFDVVHVGVLRWFQRVSKQDGGMEAKGNLGMMNAE